MKRKTLAAAVSLAYLIIIVGGGALANQGGRPGGDGTEEYDSGGSCHTTAGTGTIAASASTLAPTVSQSMTMTVTVTPATLGSTKIVGVYLVRQLQTSNSLPSVDGWQIQGDPNGGTNNYVEKTASAVSTPLEFTWSLKAPAAAGTYHLYARAHHGSSASDAVYLDLVAGLTFNVRLPGVGEPSIEHQPPSNVRLGTQILINATLINTTSAIVRWRNKEMTSPLTVNMTNTSFQSGNGWIYHVVIPAQNVSTTVTYDIVASNNGQNATATFSIPVGEGGGQRGIAGDQQLAWAISVVALVVVITGVTVLATMLFRRKLKKSS